MTVTQSGGTRRWWIMFLFFICYLVLYLDRSNIGLAGTAMMHDFGWTRSDFGYISTAFFFGYAASMILGGWLADKFGGGRVVVFGALWWSLFVFITPHGDTLTKMMLIRALMGFGEGVTLPAISAMIGKWMPKNETGIGQGIALIGVAGGIALAMPLTRWIMEAYGWPMCFYSFAFLAPIWIVAWRIWGASSPQEDTRISSAEREYIENGQVVTVDKADPDLLTTPHDAFSTPAVWIGACSFYCTNYLFYVFMTWLPMYFRDGRGLDLAQSANSTMLPWLVAAVTYPLGGWLADKAAHRFGQNIGRKIYPVVGQIGAAIMLYFVTQVSELSVAVALICGCTGLLCLTMGPYYSIPLIISKKNAGKITGLWATFATVGGVTAPTFTGWFVDLFRTAESPLPGYNAAMLFAAGLAVVGAAVLLACNIKPLEHKAEK